MVVVAFRRPCPEFRLFLNTLPLGRDDPQATARGERLDDRLGEDVLHRRLR